MNLIISKIAKHVDVLKLFYQHCAANSRPTPTATL